MDEQAEMVAVASFRDPSEAQMAKGMLEAAGVESELVGENVNNLLQAAFRVRLQVRVEDEEAALGLMAQVSGEGGQDGGAFDAM